MRFSKTSPFFAAIPDFVGRAWRGRIRLAVSYWLLGVCGNMGFVLVLAVLYVLGGSERPGWLWPIYLVSLGWFVFIFRSIHRAADTYLGRRLWARLAKLGVTVGIFRMAAEAALLAMLTWFSAAALTPHAG